MKTYYLEITSINDLIAKDKPNNNFSIKKVNTNDFILNKMLYKEVGQNYNWTDKLSWSNDKWYKYVSNKNVHTFILEDNKTIAGYFELIKNKHNVEIAFFGLIEDYINKGLGGYLLSQAITEGFKLNNERVFVHTCTLDHKNALNNYKSRGMKIYETI